MGAGANEAIVGIGGAGGPLARASTDTEGRLTAAQEPLAGLQMRCGGEIPGVIAVPELRELVAKARRFALKLARPILAQDGDETIRAWVEVAPESDGTCAITLHSWQASPLPADGADFASRRRMEIDRALAELTARLDGRQAVLTVDSDAPDLARLADAMRAGVGQPWTDFITLPGNSHRQPLHWRLLDGARVAVEGSERVWRATLVPQGDGEAQGFDLCLTSDQPLAVAPPQVAAPAPSPAPDVAVIGRDLAPVLRQPIARIIAHADTIRARLAGPLAHDYTTYAADIATAAEHLRELVEDLVDMEAIEADDFRVGDDPIDLVDVARKAAGILGMRAREKGITLALPDEGASAPAVAEFRRVLQILLNLIGNAIRYSPENSTIGLEFRQRSGRAVAVVADHGPGLGVEDQARVFEKFERLGRSGDGGSGLGLYISRRLARAMGGDLSIESVKGEGARFILDLPGR